MNANHAPHRWSDEDVESLLTEFFEHEMPRDLSAASKSAQPARRPTASTMPSPRSHAYTRLGVVTCVLLLAVTALSPTGRRFFTPKDTAVDQPVVDVEETTPKVNIAEDNQPAKSPLWDIYPPERRGSIEEPVVPKEFHNTGDDWLDKLGVRLNRLPKKRKTPRRLDGPIPFTPEKP